MSTMLQTNGFLLYADDDADDRMLLVDIFGNIAPEMIVKTVNDGYATLEFLQKETPPLPCLLILDLNMPGMNGKEVIQRIKVKDHFRNLPIVVFSTSANARDKEECASFGVDIFTKPLDLEEFERTASRLLEYCR